MPRKPFVPEELASRPFHIEEARRHGLTKHHLSGCTWTRLGGGLYALSKVAEDPLVRLIAALRRLPDAALFSGCSAAWLYGLEMQPCNPIEVTVPATSPTRRLAGLSIHRCTDIERAVVKGLPATSRVRTIVDLARRSGLIEAVALLDTALHRRLVTANQLQQWISEHPGHRGIRQLRIAVQLAEPRTESPMETRLRLLLVLAGLPRPRVQVPLYDETGMFLGRPDLYYPGKRLAIEYDGATHRESFASDNRRQNRLLDAGYRILRFTAADVLQTPGSVVSLTRRAIAAARTIEPRHLVHEVFG